MQETEIAVQKHDANPPPGDPEDVDNIREELAMTASIARKKFNKQLKVFQAKAEAAGLPTGWPPTPPGLGDVPAMTTAPSSSSSKYSADFENVIAQTREAEMCVQEAQMALQQHDANPPPGDPEDVDNMREELATTASIARKKFNKQLKKYVVLVLLWHGGVTPPIRCLEMSRVITCSSHTCLLGAIPLVHCCAFMFCCCFLFIFFLF